jgi:hypothetical protein
MTGSALVLLVMTRQLANTAASGTPFVTAVALSSTLKAGLELLRGTPRPPAFAVVMPALAGLLGFIALATLVLRRERSRRRESAASARLPAWTGDSSPT